MKTYSDHYLRLWELQYFNSLWQKAKIYFWKYWHLGTNETKPWFEKKVKRVTLEKSWNCLVKQDDLIRDPLHKEKIE